VRINLTLNVGEQTRHLIARTLKLEHPQATRDRKASRKACILWLQQQLDTAEGEHLALFRLARASQWSAADYEDASAAAAYLRSIGKSEKDIQQWILLQRARLNFPQRDDSIVI
jgi:hypothetical protein